MREHTEQTGQVGSTPGTTTEAGLGQALLREATAVLEQRAEAAAFSLVRQALAIWQKPDPQELAELTDSLLTHCASLAVGVETIPAEQRPARGAGALRDWAKLQADGPADGPLGTWSYARQLALVARNMLQAISDHRGAALERAAYVGRPNLPPLKPRSW